MEQSEGAIGFREVDQNGNPITEEAHSAVAEDSTVRRHFAVNPFIVILWLLAALLLGGGLTVFLNANLALGPSSGQMPLGFVFFTLAPHAMLGGVIAVICLLLWHANQWQQQRGQLALTGTLDRQAGRHSRYPQLQGEAGGVPWTTTDLPKD